MRVMANSDRGTMEHLNGLGRLPGHYFSQENSDNLEEIPDQARGEFNIRHYGCSVLVHRRRDVVDR